MHSGWHCSDAAIQVPNNMLSPSLMHEIIAIVLVDLPCAVQTNMAAWVF